MTRRDHVTAITGYAVLSIALVVLGVCVWAFRHDGSFMDFVMSVVGAFAVQIYGAGRHVRALTDMDESE
jgi:hypothetical protein